VVSLVELSSSRRRKQTTIPTICRCGAGGSAVLFTTHRQNEQQIPRFAKQAPRGSICFAAKRGMTVREGCVPILAEARVPKPTALSRLHLIKVSTFVCGP
jgi:hypothetical protein